MKCIVVSDSHGSPERIASVLKKHPTAEVIFFLGDGLSDLSYLTIPEGTALLAVRGNCDFTATLPSEQSAPRLGAITLCGHKILYTHGDLYGVKYHDEGLLRLAEEHHADIVLFGHTHAKKERYVPTESGGVYLFNPGALSSYDASYGVLMLDEKNVLFSHGTLL